MNIHLQSNYYANFHLPGGLIIVMKAKTIAGWLKQHICIGKVTQNRYEFNEQQTTNNKQQTTINSKAPSLLSFQKKKEPQQCDKSHYTN